MTMLDEYEPVGAPPLTQRQRHVRDDFIRRRGYWTADWEMLNRVDVEFMESYTDLSAYAKEHGVLDEKTREFIYVAACASVTHSFLPGIKAHMRQALRAGATAAELIAVLEVVSSLGVASWQLGADALEDVQPGLSQRADLDDPRRAALRHRYVEVFGVLDERVGTAMGADPDFYDTYLTMAAISRQRSRPITQKQAALVSLAANACVTHMDRAALRRDTASALHHGATPGEILEVCAIIAAIGVHALVLGLPALAEILAEEGRSPYED